MLKKIYSSIKINQTRLNIIFAFTLQVIEKSSGYIILAILTRTISQNELGAMFFAVTISRVAAVFLSMGTDSNLIRKVASDSANSLLYFSQTLSLQVVSMLAGFVVLNTIFLFVYHD